MITTWKICSSAFEGTILSLLHWQACTVSCVAWEQAGGSQGQGHGCILIPSRRQLHLWFPWICTCRLAGAESRMLHCPNWDYAAWERELGYGQMASTRLHHTHPGQPASQPRSRAVFGQCGWPVGALAPALLPLG